MVGPFADGMAKDKVGETRVERLGSDGDASVAVVAVDVVEDVLLVIALVGGRLLRSQGIPLRVQFEHCGGRSSH